jgi:hypothetical protein
MHRKVPIPYLLCYSSALTFRGCVEGGHWPASELALCLGLPAAMVIWISTCFRVRFHQLQGLIVTVASRHKWKRIRTLCSEILRFDQERLHKWRKTLPLVSRRCWHPHQGDPLQSLRPGGSWCSHLKCLSERLHMVLTFPPIPHSRAVTSSYRWGEGNILAVSRTGGPEPMVPEQWPGSWAHNTHTHTHTHTAVRKSPAVPTCNLALLRM